MSVFLFLIGAGGFIACLILLLIKALRKQPVKKTLIALGLCFVVFCIGISLAVSETADGSVEASPASTEQAGDAAQAQPEKQLEEPACEHAYVPATCETAATCTKCGAVNGNPLGHNWKAATCQAPSACERCGMTTGETAAHNWENATCQSPKTCSVCAMTEGELGEHVWQDATCQAPKTCSVCNLTEGDLIDHTWTEATCAEPKTCSVCGLEEGKTLAHKWEKATCTQPKTCAVCGLTEGDLAAHKWVKATCTKAQHCSVCEVIEGAPAEHNVAWEVTEKPTCTSKGTETGTCKVCKATFERAIDKLAHTPGNWAATDVTLLSGTVRYEQACKVCKNVVDSKDEKLTMGQINALGSAESYLSFMAFSQKGLVKQLEFEGFTKEEATFAADMCGADWFEQAAKSAESYLSFMSFSKSGLISQLKYEGFTQEQAEYGAAQNGY